MTTPIVLSFDVEQHHRIEAAAGLTCPPERADDDGRRMDRVTRQLLDLLAEHQTLATFFLVGDLAQSHPQLVRDIAAAGHEIASHGWDHRRVHRFDPESFFEDVRRCRDALEQVSGRPVIGYRAPTFSIMRATAWAVDALVEAGYHYDSSIVPVRHDRYGVPDAPRVPYRVSGPNHTITEMPVTTLRCLGMTLPAGGGGYFRLFPLGVMTAAINQLSASGSPCAMLYFHPWEFDPGQPQLPLSRLSRWRTYIGTGRTEGRLRRLLGHNAGRFARADQVVAGLAVEQLPRFALADQSRSSESIQRASSRSVVKSRYSRPMSATSR
jgi:polysaccharide deacetylase family protein (PEP-CTERM system associated)